MKPWCISVYLCDNKVDLFSPEDDQSILIETSTCQTIGSSQNQHTITAYYRLHVDTEYALYSF